MILTEKERAILRCSLRNLISHFAKKEQFTQRDWKKELEYQRPVRRLFKKLGGKP